MRNGPEVCLSQVAKLSIARSDFDSVFGVAPFHFGKLLRFSFLAKPSSASSAFPSHPSTSSLPPASLSLTFSGSFALGFISNAPFSKNQDPGSTSAACAFYSYWPFSSPRPAALTEAG